MRRLPATTVSRRRSSLRDPDRRDRGHLQPSRVSDPRARAGGSGRDRVGLTESYPALSAAAALWGVDATCLSGAYDWFGVINALGLLAGIVITSLLVPRFEHADNAALARALMLLTAVVSASVIVFGVATGFAVALGAYMLARLARRITEPLYLTWLNRNIEDSSVRATVTSMVNQSGAFGEMAGGPGVGAVGTVVSVRASLVVAGALLTPAVALYARALRHGGQEPELEELPEAV